MDDAAPNPADIPAPGSYHWTPKLQRAFLESLATTGSVKIASTSVGMSPRATYDLKHKTQGAAFKLGWAAAVLIARGRLADELLDRAIWGHEEMTTVMREEDRSLTKRRRIESRLGLAMLARLDRMVETRAQAGEEMLARIIAGDWPGFLALFDVDADNAQAEGHNAALALWLAGRDNRANPLATLWRGTGIASEVAQISALSDNEPEDACEDEPTPEEQAAAMTIWTDDVTGELRTNFPPPEDFVGSEEGRFGDEDYERSLDAEEEIAWEEACARAYAPLRKAGEAARRAFFALPDPANDPEAQDGEARKSASG
ncbi:hypothetical protein SAMN05428974_0009 [Sphingopyxis sp. YR583]|uniref:hypothetical protein n=1 Tax=Sphingopyxis sp. YR583 TaxID=1881047 RepID=UPI0008A75538|nr:hypothetical protein [Sphingopyxis sp. YR583]SEH10620.1 hypothetical protein SAMN05428974_0009 [Sphingopyxis sp. YR583]